MTEQDERTEETTTTDASAEDNPDESPNPGFDDGQDPGSLRGASDPAVDSYCCPFCESATYPTAMLVRLHVSRARDEDHTGRDGMMPEVEPVELDATGDQIGTSFTLPGKLNLHALCLDDIPTAYEGVTYEERDRRALLVAAFNANSGLALAQLQDRVTAHLEQRNMTPFSTRELESRCSQFFRPHRSNRTETTTSTGDITRVQTTLRDLTPLQQAILLTYVVTPAAEGSEVADAVETVATYPDQVVTARAALLSRLQSVVAGTTSIERLVAERIPREDIEALAEAGHLSAVDIDLEAALARKDGRATGSHEQDAVTWNSDLRTTTTPSSTDSAGSGRETVDTGSENQGVSESTDSNMSDQNPAAHSEPHLQTKGDSPGHARQDTTQESRDNTTQESRQDTTQHSPNYTTQKSRDDTNKQSRPASPKIISRGAIERVRDQVRFDLAVLEQEMDMTDPDSGYVRAKASLEQIEGRLTDILSSKGGKS